MKATLTRQLSSDEGTFGELTFDGGGFSSLTLELPWRNNLANVSCVKIGDYHAAMAWSHKHQKNVYHLQDENDRVAVEIHSYNLAGDVEKGYIAQAEGCISLGTAIAVFKAGMPPAGSKDQRGLTNSADAVGDLEAFTKGADFDLTICYAADAGSV
jgi:Family of unknown function (DUF5675)